MKIGVARFFDTILQDLRYSIQISVKHPGFTIVVVLLTAIGVGANTAIFSMINAVLLQSLPVADPGRLAIVAVSNPRGPNTRFSYPMYQDLRDRNEAFSGMIAHFSTPMSLSVDGGTERILGELVSGNYFQLLGISSAVGRTLTIEDDRTPGSHPVVVLSYAYWQRRFNSDPQVIGKKINLNTYPFTVIGVSAREFTGIKPGSSPDVRVPMMMEAQIRPESSALTARNSSWLEMMARLKPGLERAQAEQSVNLLFRQLLQAEYAGRTSIAPELLQQILRQQLELIPGNRGWSDLRQQYAQPLLMVMTLVFLVLLITCANIANLLLVRAVGRRREMGVRLAIGAERSRLIRQLLTESILLSMVGGMLGIWLAYWMQKGFVLISPQDWLLTALNYKTDLRVMLFALTAATLTGLAFGLVPALQAVRPDLATILKDQTEVREMWAKRVDLKKLLVSAQVALSLMLLIVASVFVRSLQKLRDQPTGFRRENLIMASLDPSLNGYQGGRAKGLYRQLLERLESVPGIQSVGITSSPLLGGRVNRSTIAIEGYIPKVGEDMQPDVNIVSTQFFATVGIPLITGRSFQATDNELSPRVALINRSMAKRYFQDENPIGKRFGFGKKRSSEVEIIGVIEDIKLRNLREEGLTIVYLPAEQSDLREMTVYLRSTSAPRDTIAAVRRELHALEKDLPLFNVRTMEEQVDRSLAPERLTAALATLFGLLALLPASLGIYGVVAYTAGMRTREIGIRMALGASPPAVLRMILRDAAIVVLFGAVVGIPASYFLTRYFSAMLYGIGAIDPLSLAAAFTLVALIAIFAAYLPAHRAAKINPVTALRHDL